MKKITTLFTAMTISVSVFSQVPTWDWATEIGAWTTEASGYSVDVDINGNSYAVGYFTGSINFGSTTLVSASSSKDFFIVKFDPLGNIIWAKQAGGAGQEIGRDINVDISGNCYVTGEFSSLTMTFGSTVLTNDNVNNTDIFVVKYDSFGNVLWAKGIGSSRSAVGNGIALDANNKCYVTGGFSSDSITFGSVTLHNTGAAGTSDIFVTKYDSAGNVVWATNAGGTGGESATGIDIDANGNSYITGEFWSSSLTFGSSLLTCLGYNDVLVAKFDSLGNEVWARSGRGNGHDLGWDITVDASGNSYVAGRFEDWYITFDSIILNGVSLGGFFFIVKYDASGNILWGNNSGGGSQSAALAVAIDLNNSVYITGSFGDSLHLDTLLITYPHDMTYFNGFIAKYNATGNAVWCKSFGGTTYDYPTGLAIDNNGACYVTGEFSYGIIFDTDTLPNLSGFKNIVVAKLGSPIVGIDESPQYKYNFSLFPNPATTEATINFGKAELYNVQLLNTLGEILEQTQINSSTLTLDMSNKPKGIYFISVTDEAGNKTVRKVVKM